MFENLVDLIYQQDIPWDEPFYTEIDLNGYIIDPFLVEKDDGYYKLRSLKIVGGKTHILVTKYTNYIFEAKTLKKVITPNQGEQESLSIILKAKGKINREVDLDGTDLLCNKNFTEKIAKTYVGMHSRLEYEDFFTLIEDAIKKSEKITEFQSTGLYKKQNFFIYSNAIVDIKRKQEYYSDKQNSVTIDGERYCISPAPDMPKFELYKENFDSEISKELLINLQESFPEASEVLLILGLAVMIPFVKIFQENGGFPICFMTGKQSCGKTTLLKLISNIYGSNKLHCGGSSTAYSLRTLLGKLSGIPVLADEIGERVMKLFSDLIKDVFTAIPRAKGVKTGELIYQYINSGLMVTSNEMPEMKAEIITRLLTANWRTTQIDTSKYLYFDNEKAKKLSLIIPEVLKFTESEILSMYEKSLSDIDQFLPESFQEHRVKHNFAIALSGIRVLERISNYEIPDLSNKIADYFEKYALFLNIDNSLIGSVIDFLEAKILQGDLLEGNHYLYIKKNGILKIQVARTKFFETYNFENQHNQISRKIFDCYAKTDQRIINTSTSREINNKKTRVVEIDVSDRSELLEFFEDHEASLSEAQRKNEDMRKQLSKINFTTKVSV